jgi:hypothetical protein
MNESNKGGANGEVVAAVSSEWWRWLGFIAASAGLFGVSTQMCFAENAFAQTDVERDSERAP